MKDFNELVIWALSIFGCYKLAEKNNRNTTVAIVIGAIFSVLAFAGYFAVDFTTNKEMVCNFISSLKKKEE